MVLDSLLWPLLWVAVWAALVVWLFRSGHQFGVEHRRNWRTMLREGWWAGAIATALYLPEFWMIFSRF
jgi:hypothetical protein